MISFSVGTASKEEIRTHLLTCDNDFIPSLSSRVKIEEYSEKIFCKALTFEAWNNKILVGLIAAYVGKEIFITSISVLKTNFHQKIASKLLQEVFKFSLESSLSKIVLEVDKKNFPALSLYKKFGFSKIQERDETLILDLNLRRDQMTRDYNEELKTFDGRPYMYNFDLNVMHPLIIRSFESFFREGSILELGGYKGDFTKRLLPYSNEITSIEVSSEAIKEARLLIPSGVRFIEGAFENVKLDEKFANVIITHVLEHLDTPLSTLSRVREEWLEDTGYLFVVSPNANAASRQIAVEMGLLDHTTVITEKERKSGHRITFTLESLKKEVRMAGFKVVYSSGIFFKALASFQWDSLLQTDIISPEYLEGCYELGQRYPDLCSSIFVVCKKDKK